MLSGTKRKFVEKKGSVKNFHFKFYKERGGTHEMRRDDGGQEDQSFQKAGHLGGGGVTA